MRILFVSQNFPPEVNAPAVRLSEHARQWMSDGHGVEVLTSVPHFPEGEVYEGFDNRLAHDQVDGIETLRVPMYVAENKGALKRIISYVSFMFSAFWFCRRTRHEPDLVVATSPQFFAGVGGFLISRRLGVPFVLEIRDLWPESIVAVGAMSRNLIIRLLEKLERYLYRKADHIVVVTNSFRDVILGHGIEPEKISVLKNGFDLSELDHPLNEDRLRTLRSEHDLEGKFVASYIGTIGMAHRVDVILEAAHLCKDEGIVFMIVGTGAERKKLESMKENLQLDNVRLVDKQPKDLVPYFLSLSDVSIVHLKKSELFKTVIPSKMFEAMALGRPIILGVEGESREILNESGAGIPITAEQPDELLEAILELRASPSRYAQMSRSGVNYVNRFHDRRKLARRYWTILESTRADGNSTGRRMRSRRQEMAAGA